jgi:hypothetical protein
MRRRIHAYHMRRIRSYHMRRSKRISLSIPDKRRKGGVGRKEDCDTAFFRGTWKALFGLAAQPVCYSVF